MKIRAATLAGGVQNQDAYIIGDNFAGVFDGASNHLNRRQGSQDTVWYVQTLAQAVKDALPLANNLPEAIYSAIRFTVGKFRGPLDACPTSTVALARWTEDRLETLVLGDSTIMLISQGQGCTKITDSRMDSIGSKIRRDYRSALQRGAGFSRLHHERLRDLQKLQSLQRNRPSGFWIAGNDPHAAHHALSSSVSRSGVLGIALGSDGGACVRDYGIINTWADLLAASLDDTLSRAHALETLDPDGRHHPRSKIHDDKTLIVVDFAESA